MNKEKVEYVLPLSIKKGKKTVETSTLCMMIVVPWTSNIIKIYYIFFFFFVIIFFIWSIDLIERIAVLFRFVYVLRSWFLFSVEIENK